MSEVICMQTTAFYGLLDQVIEHIDEKFKLSKESKWVTTEMALEILNIKSRTTLQEMRDSGKIRFSQPSHKHLLYDRNSLLQYIEQHAKETF
jgi:hypothetical protein